MKGSSLTIFFLLLTASLYSVIGINAYSNYYHEIDLTNENNEAFAQAAEQYTVGIVSRIDLMLKQLSRKQFVRKLNQSALPKQSELDNFSQELAIIASDFPELEAIAITDPAGNAIAHNMFVNNNRPQRIDVSERAYFKHHQTTPNSELFVSEPLIAKATGSPVINLSRRLEDNNGNFLGVIYATFRQEALCSFFEKATVGTNGNIVLLNKNHELIARYPLIREALGRKIQISDGLRELLDQGLTKGSFISVSNVDGIERMLSYRSFEKLPFMLLIGKTKKTVLHSWAKNLGLSLVMSTLLLSFVGFALLRFRQESVRQEQQNMILINSAKMSSLGEMASGVAHEINNPLAIIAGHAESMTRYFEKGQLQESDIKALGTKIEKIQNSVNRIAKIVRGLRNFSRSGDRDPLAKVGIQKIITSVLDLSAEKFKSSGVQVITGEIPAVSIRARETQIEQILINLLNNAYDAILGQANPWIKIDFKTNNSRIAIEITDSGPGIPDSLKEKIMIPFFTTKEIGKGTGLGLSISKGIAEEHSGRLQLNEKSPNTCFVLELPILEEPVSIAPPPELKKIA